MDLQIQPGMPNQDGQVGEYFVEQLKKPFRTQGSVTCAYFNYQKFFRERKHGGHSAAHFLFDLYILKEKVLERKRFPDAILAAGEELVHAEGNLSKGD